MVRQEQEWYPEGTGLQDWVDMSFCGFGVPQQLGAGGCTLLAPLAQLGACCAAAGCRRHLDLGTKWLLMQLL